MNKYLYPIKNLKTKSYIKWWLYRYLDSKTAKYILSEILEGTSFYLDDSVDKPFNLFEIYGNTTQESATGKQLFNKDVSPTVNNGGGNVIVLDTGVKLVSTSTRQDANIFGSQIYRLINLSNYVGSTIRIKASFSKSSNTLVPKYSIGLCDENGGNRIAKVSSTTSNTEISFVVPSLGVANYLATWLYLTEQTTSINTGDYVEYTNIIVTIDNADMTYEPYTEGSPAPSPSFPFPINNTGDEGYINEKVSNFDNSKSQVINFPLAQGQKLMQGDYLADDGIHHVMGEIILDGSENWLYNASSESNNVSAFALQMANIKSVENTDTDIRVFCDKFKRESANVALQIRTQNIIALISNKRIYLCVPYSDFGTNVSNIKTWLSNNNIKVQYPLETEVIDAYTEEQQTVWEQIKRLRTYKPVTHISSSNGTPSTLKIQYYKEAINEANN